MSLSNHDVTQFKYVVFLRFSSSGQFTQSGILYNSVVLFSSAIICGKVILYCTEITAHRNNGSDVAPSEETDELLTLSTQELYMPTLKQNVARRKGNQQ